MQVKWASLIHGRPSHISEDDWTVQPLTEKDFPENAADDDEREGSTEVEKGRSIFCHMVSLTQILADVLQTCYSGRAENEIRAAKDKDATKFVLSRAKPLQMRLNAWHASLPQSLSMDNVTIRKLSSTGYLHLAYWATVISLHRSIFRTLHDCSESDLASICRNAARTRLTHAITFVKALKPEHLQSFWYFASAFNFAFIGIFQSLICVCADTKAEMNIELATLDEYRWMLRVSSKSAGFLEQSMGMIDLYAGRVKTLVYDAESDESFDRGNDGDSAQKDVHAAEWAETLPSAEGEIGDLPTETPHFEDDASISMRTDDTSLAWYAQTPSTEQADHALRTWEGLDLGSAYQQS